jgi:(heptosyl)LPS beta-1,4-glucosyltransferase
LRLGAFVIHGDNGATLGRCLDSLAKVAESCVAVDTGSTDGSAALARARGIRRLELRWEGYGAARARGAEALRDCDYVFFLDSDEWLEAAAVEALRAWKAAGPTAPHYTLVRRDWAVLGGRRFLYRTERHVRLVRRDLARWTPEMIVHETLPRAETIRLPIVFEHGFADDVEAMRAKAERYALLWAIRFRRTRRRMKPPALQHLAHLLRETLLKGAAFRGGLPAVQLARAIAFNHARKYELLRAVRAGGYPELVRAYDEGRLDELFRLLDGAAPCGPRAAETRGRTSSTRTAPVPQALPSVVHRTARRERLPDPVARPAGG